MSSDDATPPPWPQQVARLLARHPRSTWRTHRSPYTAFWLEVHDGLRRQCSELESAAAVSGEQAVLTLALTLGPLLRGFVTTLAEHHRVEDSDYFPTLRNRAPEIAGGFDLLEREHHALDDAVARAVTALADLEAAARSVDRTALLLAAARCRAAGAQLCQGVRDHLGAEENVVVPLLLELEGATAED